MYYYQLFYGSTFLRDSSNFGDYYETEEEAYEEAETERDYRIEMWKIDDAWNEWDSIEEFDIIVKEC